MCLFYRSYIYIYIYECVCACVCVYLLLLCRTLFHCVLSVFLIINYSLLSLSLSLSLSLNSASFKFKYLITLPFSSYPFVLLNLPTPLLRIHEISSRDNGINVCAVSFKVSTCFTSYNFKPLTRSLRHETTLFSFCLIPHTVSCNEALFI